MNETGPSLDQAAVTLRPLDESAVRSCRVGQSGSIRSDNATIHPPPRFLL